MSEGATVTAIVPVYPGNKKTINDCIHNIVSQTYPLHVIFLFNNSRPYFVKWVVMKLIKRWFNRSIHDYEIVDMGIVKGMPTDPRVTKKSGIISYVINEGYEMSEGQFNVLIPADVLIPIGTIELMLKTFEMRPDAGVVCLTCYYRNPYMNMPMLLLEEGEELDSIQYHSEPIFEARAGNGAMMVSKRVYKALKWRTSDLGDLNLGADYLYCVDTKDQFGLKTYIRTDVEVFHIDPDGKRVYWSGRVPETTHEMDDALKKFGDAAEAELRKRHNERIKPR